VRILRIALTALIAVSVTPALVFGQWRAPVTVSSGGTYLTAFRDVRAAVDGQGAGLVVWGTTFPESAVFAADVRADGTVGPEARLSAPGVAARTPRLTVAADGRAALVWSVGPTSFSRSSGPRVLQLVTRPPGGSWSAPHTVVAHGRNVPGDLVFEPSGDLALASTRRHQHNSHVELRHLSFDGKTRSTETVANHALAPVLAVSPTFRHAVIAYYRRPDDDIRREAWLRIGNRSWRLGRQVVGRPKVSAGRRVVVAWTSGEAFTEEDGVHVAQVARGGRPRVQRVGDAEAFERFAVAAEGDRALVGWNATDATGHRDALLASADDGPFGAPVDPTAGTASARTPAFAIGDTRAAALFIGYPTNGPSITAINSGVLTGALSQDGGPFAAPTVLSAEGEGLDDFGVPAIAMNAAGAAVVGYLGANHLAVTSLPAG
jgi:hypothetical protein